MPVQLRGPAVTVSVRPMSRLRRLSRPSLALASRRFAPGLALLGALGLGSLVACEKTPDADTNTPSTPGAAGGTVMRYKVAPSRLKETIKVSFGISGGGGTGEIKVDATGLLDISDAGNGKLKIGRSVVEVRELEMTGALKPKPKEGEPLPDFKAELLAGKGASIIDALGNEDKGASAALPENAKKKDDAKSEFSGFMDFLGLPSDLPAEGLAEGTPWKTKKEEPAGKGPMAVDMESDLTYTLVKIDASSGKRLAELKIEAEASGATEMSQGGQSMMISVDATTESTIVFNLDDQIPVSYHLAITQVGTYGQRGSGELRISIDATYEPAT